MLRNYKKAYYELLKEYNTIVEMHGNQKEYIDYLELRVEMLKRLADKYLQMKFKDDNTMNEISEKIYNELNEPPAFDSEKWAKDNGIDLEGGL